MIAQGQAANASKSARHLGIASLVLSIIGIVIGIIIIVTVVVYVFTVVQTYRSEAEKSVIFFLCQIPYRSVASLAARDSIELQNLKLRSAAREIDPNLRLLRVHLATAPIMLLLVMS